MKVRKRRDAPLSKRLPLRKRNPLARGRLTAVGGPRCICPGEACTFEGCKCDFLCKTRDCEVCR